MVVSRPKASLLVALGVLLVICVMMLPVGICPVGSVRAAWAGSLYDEMTIHSVVLKDVGVVASFDSVNDQRTISTGTHFHEITVVVSLNYSNGVIYGLITNGVDNNTVIGQSVGAWSIVDIIIIDVWGDAKVVGVAGFIGWSGQHGWAEYDWGYATYVLSGFDYVINSPGDYGVYVSFDIHRMG